MGNYCALKHYPQAQRAERVLYRWLLTSEWRLHPLRTLIAVFAIALGVALGYAIDLINSTAVNEFSSALHSLSGQSDLQVRASTDYFNEAVYPFLARQPGVANAAPILEIRVRPPGQKQAMTVLGIDAFRTGPGDLAGRPAASNRLSDLFAADSLFLSSAAQAWLGVQPGQTLSLGGFPLRIAGDVLNARPGQRIAVLDIATAQWRFQHLGQLSRIEIKLAPNTKVNLAQQAIQQSLQNRFPGQFNVTRLAQREERASNMSRAYRVNLNMLALIALLTGAFLVFSNQALAVMRRRSQFALLRVLGWKRRQLLLYVLLEGLLTGLLGALLGIGLGYGVAYQGLQWFGADLGAGYFNNLQPDLHFDLFAAVLFISQGCLISLAGCLAPALQAAQIPLAINLKAGEAVLGRQWRPWLAWTALILAAIFSQLPALAELPIFAYLAIALLLVGSIALMPQLCSALFSWCLKWCTPHHLRTLALARLANSPGQAGIALGGLLTSFSLMVAMGIMVNSFRFSVDEWLQQILPADIYIRAANNQQDGTLEASLSPAQQQILRQLPGIAQIDFQRSQNILLDPARPAVALLARTTLPNIDKVTVLPGQIPVWVSEAMPDLYGFTLGKTIQLPLGGQLQTCIVAGINRDYAHQFGSIIISNEAYRRLSGDKQVNDIAIWLQPSTNAATFTQQIRQLPFSAQLDIALPGEIRKLSLQIFDRSFAITYLLEVVAIVIGLFGVASSFSAQTLARSREFGMLQHLGYKRSEILHLLALEGAWLGALGVLFGFVAGYATSLILVFVINPQSFHWKMTLAVPWGLLCSIGIILWAAASATALLAGQQSGGIGSSNALRAVRED